MKNDNNKINKSFLLALCFILCQTVSATGSNIHTLKDLEKRAQAEKAANSKKNLNLLIETKILLAVVELKTQHREQMDLMEQKHKKKLAALKEEWRQDVEKSEQSNQASEKKSDEEYQKIYEQLQTELNKEFFLRLKTQRKYLEELSLRLKTQGKNESLIKSQRKIRLKHKKRERVYQTNLQKLERERFWGGLLFCGLLFVSLNLFLRIKSQENPHKARTRPFSLEKVNTMQRRYPKAFAADRGQIQ